MPTKTLGVPGATPGDLGMVALILTNLVVGIGLCFSLPSYNNEPIIKILRGPQGGFNGFVGFDRGPHALSRTSPYGMPETSRAQGGPRSDTRDLWRRW